MTPERWKLVEALFQAALRRPQEERRAFLEAECGADPTLKGDVLSLLKADAQAGSFLETPGVALPLATDARSPAPGDRLGPYEILGRLGAGGMGEVYRARDPRLGREVAIKVLAPSRAGDKDARARFEREAKTASALNHPHIVNIYEIGEAEAPAGPTYYIAMELVEGQTLRQRLRGGAGWRNLIGPLTQVADALAKAHKAGIVHRDLKPENIMITPDGYPKVLDFGLAKLMEGADVANVSDSDPTRSFEGHTRAGTILGTPGYMSPEQVQGKALDPRSDVFSFGCILYEAAAGRRPFKGSSEVETLHAIVHDEPPPIESLTTQIPPELGRVIRRCLAKDPEQRYQAIRDLANDLRELAHEAAWPYAASGLVRLLGSKPGLRWLVAGALTAAVVLVGAGLRSRAGHGAPSTSGRHGSLQVEKLTNRGNVSGPTISPNGRYLAYASPADGGVTIWLRDLTERTETRLAGPIETAYLDGIRFGKDGQSVYYSFRSKVAQESAVYRVPLIGGDSRLVRADASLDELSPDEKHLARSRRREGQWTLLMEDLDGAPEKALGEAVPRWLYAWSPDGSELLFGRVRDGRQSLSLLNADGTAERKIADLPHMPQGAWWSPDGASVVLALYEELYESARLFDLTLATGATKPISDRLFLPRALDWLPDGKAFVLNDGRNGQGALYLVSYPDGKIERIPRDTHAYEGLGTTRDGTKIVSAQSVERSDILVSLDREKGPFKNVATGTDVRYRMCWTADGKLVYGANDGGSYDLYVSDADGSNRKQLTFDRESNETQPVASPDGRYVVFVSDRTGEQGLYRINRDGTDLKSLTPKPVRHNRDYDPKITPDSRWVLYRHWDNGPALWKVPIDGGVPVLIKGARPPVPSGPVESAFGATASPDGRSLAFFYFEQDPKSLKFSSVEIAVAALDGRILKRFPIPTNSRSIPDGQRVQWSRDGGALFYNLYDREVRALWKQSLAGGSPAQVTHFEEPLHYFEWSFDGKALAVSRSSTLSDVVMITDFR